MAGAGKESLIPASDPHIESKAGLKVNLGEQHPQRLSGWNRVHKVLASPTPSSRDSTTEDANEKVKLRVQLAQPGSHTTSLLDMCAQELFSALMMSLAGDLKFDKTAIVERDGMVQLENPTVRVFSNAFVRSGLGSDADALLCIIPPLRKQLPPPSQEDILWATTKAADGYRRKSEWERAEIMLQWACAHFSAPHGEVNNSGHLLVSALRSLGELYRWSLAQTSSNERTESFGRSGIKRMAEDYRNTAQNDPKIEEILICYGKVVERITQSSTHEHPRQYSDRTPRSKHPLLEAIQNGDRAETLSNLCFVTTGAFSSNDLQPALPLAVKRDWAEIVNAILEMKANPNSQDEDGRTAISYCAELGLESYVKPLMEHGASADLSDKDQLTPLLWTACNGHEEVATLLLGTEYVDINRPDKNSRTALSFAVEHDRPAMVQLLLNKGASINSCQSALAWATVNEHQSIFQSLLDKGADIESKDNVGRTALSCVAETGNIVIFQSLLDKGADIESKDDTGRTALSYAAETGNIVISQSLLDKGADTKSKDKYSRTALSYAAQYGHDIIVQRLLDNGADIESKDTCSRTALLHAAQYGHEIVVQRLRDNGADIESRDHVGRTALLYAALQRHDIVVQRLLDNGADIESKDHVGRTALLYAALQKHDIVVQRLLDNGADIESKDKFGRTALSYAAKYGHEIVVQTLLDNGADPKSRDNAS